MDFVNSLIREKRLCCGVGISIALIGSEIRPNETHCREHFNRQRERKQAAQHYPVPAVYSAYSSAPSRASSPENRFSVRLFLTAIASAFRCPMSTTSFFPRVMPV